ncbi:MAG TPA: amidase family protein, partial [Jatrophihabitantaceae bacterium]|nr:amidase family protein [Jatrophihabitantaceae bacterium]
SDRDAQIGAFQVVRTFAALREADELDARPDKDALPLAGVPIAIKDNVPVAGEPMRAGSEASDPRPQDADHEVVRRLRAAGAIVVGITRCPELCVFGSTDGAFGITRNPWDLDRTPGGSSGGSAAAVAAGLVPLAHANDGMGSIRIPSACCGLVGLKPGLDVVPSGLGNGSWFDMAENGAVATTVDDLATALSVLAARPEFAVVREPSRQRIAISTRVPMLATPLDKHWRAVTGETGLLLREAGHTVTLDDAPYSQRMIMSELARWFAGTEMDARQMADRSKLEARNRRQAAAGRLAMRFGLPKPQGRYYWQQRAARYFENVDVLITPMLAQPPKHAALWSQRGWLANLLSDARYAPFAAPWNLAGWPAMAVPAGLHPNGTPLSVQLVAPPGRESLLLGVAATLERLRPWQRLAPEQRNP